MSVASAISRIAEKAATANDDVMARTKVIAPVMSADLGERHRALRRGGRPT
jgi:hypothetical protein